jgi:hypothetical protein
MLPKSKEELEKSLKDFTPYQTLKKSCENGSIEGMKIAIEKSNVDILDDYCILLAVKNNHIDLANYLLDNYKIIIDDLAEKILFYAIRNKQHDFIKKILNYNNIDLTKISNEEIKLYRNPESTWKYRKDNYYGYNEKLNSFDDFLFENIESKDIVLYYSDRFRNILYSINHPIANKLLNIENNTTFKTSVSYIDIDTNFLFDGVYDIVSFITYPKLIELIKNEDSIDITEHDYTNFLYKLSTNNSYVYKKYRTYIKINKLINKLFPNEFKPSGDYGKDMESFVNMFKANNDKNTGIFEIVNGNDIVKWYNEENYLNEKYDLDCTSLGKSCMRYDSCEDYINFYANNPDKVSMLILKDKEYPLKIKGRALIWKLNKPDNRIFMDRIYTILDSDIELFKQYAIKNKWIYKLLQSATSTIFIDPITNKNSELIMTVNDFKDNYDYPYMDTLLYYSKDENILTNNKKEIKAKKFFELRDTDGTYSIRRNGIYIDYYNDYFLEEDVIYCEIPGICRLPKDAIFSDYYNKFIALDYARNSMVYCKYGNEYRFKKDAIYLGVYKEFTTKEYLKSKDNIFVWDNNISQLVKKTDFKK